mgnify:CR=1 FL=1
MKANLLIAIALCLCLLAAGCAKTAAPDAANTPANTQTTAEDVKTDTITLPTIAETYFAGQDIATPPDEIYSTTAEENGLAGTVYRIIGKVTRLDSSLEDETGFTLIRIEMENGEDVIVGNPLHSALDSIGEGGNADKCRALFRSPEQGDTVEIYCGYLGFSDEYKLPTFLYGGEAYLNDAIMQCIDAEAYFAEQEAQVSEEPEPTPEPTQAMTAGQRNALASALSYLKYMPFSYTGLIEQLEYEKFSTEDATYAADHCGADWNEQAAKCAESYLSHMSFSYDGLVEQLEYEGFTHDQAVYGADKAYN